MAETELTTELNCPRCQQSNAPHARRCRQCHQPLTPVAERPAPSEPEASPEPPAEGENQAARPRRRSLPMSVSNRTANVVAAIRLVAVLYLFWSIIDNSNWLSGVTAALAPEDPAALRYNIFAMYEILRNMGLVAGVWLLTMLRPRRGA